ncbi:autotransporter outer membrane beta-barrel domain-containing protein [Hyphococcus flavus]|uniref:Autotransporter outer membrane beta-barrel domain-containing protein n=1 Tax=Hyphococcus flavus TaxID=1866326 RepID=A0AAE9ZBI5_9PROT|nr:autotransporter outer membrane beta-barrel domain-containing protein [Hyphococcus flavus]WDI30155.1 autotransporter outer membrane beta-barrel domain-containing protein [Hyphococcus flavus]
MTPAAKMNKKNRLGRLLATTCLTALPVFASSGHAQQINETGTDLGGGADKGTVSGGAVNVSGAADVRGVGVSTGTGSDRIENTSPIDVDVLANEAVVFSGFSAFQDGADVRAEGIGLFGHNGRDTLTNTGDINVQTTGVAGVVNLGLNLFGFLNFNAPSNVEVISTGIDGGFGADVIDNQGTIFSNSIAGISMIGQNPSSFEQGAIVEITSNATTTGIRGTRNRYETQNSGTMTLAAAASATSSTLDIEIVNGVVVDSSTNANSTVIGIEGDTIRDWISNSGTIIGVSSASALRGSFALSLSDGGIGDNSLNATAMNSGLWGGMSDDQLFNTGDITISAGAHVESTSVEINLIDVSGGSFNLAPEAVSVGIDGGIHDDLLDNSGAINSTATSESYNNSVNLSLIDATIVGGRISAGFDSGTDQDVEPPIQATAIGLSGGDGEDMLLNHVGGLLGLTGNANAESVTVSVAAIGVPEAAFQSLFLGETLASLDTFASSQIIGMTGGLNEDQLYNYGDITGMTTSTAQQVGVAVSIPAGFLPDAAGYLPGWTLGGAGAATWADAIGMSGDEGGDILFNDGLIDLTTLADALAVGVSVEIPDLSSSDGFAFDLSFTLADVVTDSDAFITGVSGGDGDDTLSNTEAGEIIVDATANAASTGIGVTAAVEAEGVVSEGVMVRAATDAEATATAMDGGAGDDTIINDGVADATANANANTVGVTFALEGVSGGGAAGVAAVDGSANATATAQSITGGDGADLLVNNGALSADATATANATGVSVALTGAQMGGFAGAGTLSITGATATADASGVDWSSDDQGAENRGSIETTATANAVGDSVSVGMSGTLAGFTLNASLADSSTTSVATASAFDAPSGDHEITNFETLSAISNTTADSDSIAAELGVVVQAGLAAGAALTRTVTDATATSTGIISDLGVDEITNLGTITADATADVSSTSLAIGLNGTLAGVAINAAAADGRSTATANATGISTGQFGDTALTVGTLTSTSNADANADSVAIEIAATVQAGLAAGAALTRADVTAGANSIGVATGDGADALGAAGTVDVMATATADADSVAVSGQGTAAGATLGATLVEASTTANADASGLNAGEGDDDVVNASTLTAMSMADASSTGVGVKIGANGAGFSGGLALANVSSNSNAAAAAMEGGLGADVITNFGMLDVDADADASGAAVSVTLEGVLAGASLGVSLTDATADATAYATGIAGDEAARLEVDSENDDDDNEVEIAATGSENADIITNYGALFVDTVAKSTGASVSVAAPVSFVPLGFALATAENTATGNAYGVDGGFGDDSIFNMADITVKSDVDVTGASAAASVSVLALGDFDGRAYSNAYGVTGGWGDDYLFNNATVMSTALADVLGVTATLNLAGGAVGDLSTTADADAFGIFGDAGPDTIFNEGAVTANADVKAASTNVSLSVVGFTVNDVSTHAFADATGIGGGGDNDTINNAGEVMAITLAESPGVSVSLTGAGAIFNDASTMTQATSHGLSGGAGDDEILNTNAVTATSTAKTMGVGVSVGLISGGTANVSTTADATAHAINGGSGADTIVNRSMLTSTATATTSSTGVNVNIAGAAFADGDTDSIAHAVGIAGGGGSDAILNESVINATANANNSAGAISVSLGGVADGDINTVSTANAAGIEGGAGDDVIGHDGAITAMTTANVNAQIVTVGAVGAGLGDVRLTAATNGFGIDGGEGSDEIITFEDSTIVVGSNITGNANNTSIQLVGGTSNKNVFGFTPSSTGVAGGGGDDNMALYGTADIDATTNFTLNNTAITLIGAAFDNSGVTSSPTATGVSGGAGDDVIYVGDLVDARSTNIFSMSGLTVNLAGYSSTKPTVGGTSTAIGVDAGGNNDTVLIDGRINANASSTNTVGGTQITILGANQSSAQTGAMSTAAGVLGGAGDDMLLLDGITDVDATATAKLNSLAFTLIGASVGNDSITAIATATGLDAGDDNDIAGNGGSMFVDTTSTLTTSGAIGVSFGAAVSSAATTSNATSSGILGGDGDDYLFNTGYLRVNSNASGTINRTNYAFVGGAVSSATANATANSLGIGGGAGADDIENTGTLKVISTSSTDASGNTIATVGGAKSSSNVAATARSVGIAGDAGDDFLKNFGVITVSASASPDSTNLANTGGFFTDGVTDSRTTTSTRVIGIDGGTGENVVWNTGGINIETLGTARTESRSDGDILDNIFGLDLDAVAKATSSNNGQDARGVSAGNEATTLYNDGVIDVAVRGHGYAYANADGDAIVDGDGTATAIVGVSTGRAYGFVAGNGDNTLVNAGEIIVLSRPTGNADAISDADGVDAFAQPDSRATASVSVNSARAAGAWLNNGDDVVVNEGLIDVTAEPRADQAEADAGFGGDVLGIDAFATATANANNASAYGIRAGNGDNTIYNTGDIIARSIPRAVANADARGVGFDGDASGSATANALNALAIGVETGSGNDLVWNEGTISAISNPSVSATVNRDTGRACAIDIGDVEVCESGEVGGSGANTNIDGRRAIGVSTNGGDDFIVNAGTITPSLGNATGNGEAILMGSGDDLLAMLGGSSVLGSINLGSGNDTLLLSGASTSNSNPTGSSGTDTLLFEGAGSFNRGFSSFETAMKTGEGLYIVPSLPSVTSLAIGGGTLQSTASYAFNTGGVYSPVIQGGGGHGRFASSGTATLGGAIEVIDAGGVYTNGATFEVVSGSSVAGSFATETLPEPTPLLSFDLVQLPSAVQVIADVASFATVASASKSDQSFASQLDEAVPVAGGALASHLARIQHLPEGADFEAEIAQLNPARFSDFAQDTAATAQRFESGARQRLSELRQVTLEGEDQSSFVRGANALRFANSSQFEAGDGVMFGAWRAEFGAAGDNFMGGSGTISGFDYLTPTGAIFGASFGTTRSYSAFAAFAGEEGQIDNFMMSFYASQRISSNQYLDAIISYGEQEYDSSSNISGSARFSPLQTNHEGRNLSASIETGRGFAFAGGQSEIFGGVRYETIGEGRFEAVAMGDVAFDIDRQDAHGLEGEIGIRFGWNKKSRAGAFLPRLSLAYNRRLALGSDRILASFADAPGVQFDLPSELRSKNKVRIGAGFDLLTAHNVSVSSRFEVDAVSPDENARGLLDLKFRW